MIKESTLSHIFVVTPVNIDGIKYGSVSSMTLKFIPLRNRAAEFLSELERPLALSSFSNPQLRTLFKIFDHILSLVLLFDYDVINFENVWVLGVTTLVHGRFKLSTVLFPLYYIIIAFDLQ